MIKQTEKEAVQLFAEAMVAKIHLRSNKYEKFGWLDPNFISLEELEKHLWEEMREYFTSSPRDPMELVDIANMCFMLRERLLQDNKNVCK